MRNLIYILILTTFSLVSCAPPMLTRAKIYINNNEYYLAKSFLEKIISNNLNSGNENSDENGEAYYLLGYVEGELNNLDAMIEYFDKSKKISYKYSADIEQSKKYYWAINFNKGVASYNNEEYEQAKIDFENALKLNPHDEKTMQNYTYVLMVLTGEGVSTNEIQPTTNENNLSTNSQKDIDGFQNFKWDLSLQTVKDLLINNKYEIDNSKGDMTIVSVSDFTFQGKETLLHIALYKDKIYKVTLYFTVGDNTAGMNEYFSMANLIKDVYGDTRKIAIGRESDDYDHRVTQISIGDLSYQHIWNSNSGNLVFQLSQGSYGSFICSLFYSSKDAKKIEDERAKSEF